MSETLDQATVTLVEKTPYANLHDLGDFLCQVAGDFKNHDKIIAAWEKKLLLHFVPNFYPEVMQTLLAKKTEAERTQKFMAGFRVCC